MSDPVLRSKDHVRRALLRRLEQFRNKPVLESMIVTYVDECQAFENAIWEVEDAWLNPTGHRLDMLGAIVGRGRGGLDDTNYLRAIFAQMLANRSSGEMDVLTEIAELMSPEATTHVFTEAYPAGIRVFSDGADFDVKSLFDLLRLAKSAGVRLEMVVDPFGTPEAGTTFRYAPYDTDPAPGLLDGYTSIYDDTVGGFYAYLLVD